MNPTRHLLFGFSLVDLMIALAVVAVLLALALPSDRDSTIRAKVAEALRVAVDAELAVAETCRSDGTRTVDSNDDAGYSFTKSSDPDSYVADVQVLADCPSGTMGIIVTTKNTGAEFEPVILLTSDGRFTPVGLNVDTGNGRINWYCSGLSASPAHLPSGCRITPKLPGREEI
jgi:type IV pilus assembly protein PilA